MAILGSNCLNLHIDAVDEALGACVRDLVTHMNKLVLEKVHLGSEFRVYLNQGVTTLTNSQILLHEKQLFQTLSHGFGR